MLASDLSSYDQFVVANEFLFNKGENDEIVTLHPFNKTTLPLQDRPVYAMSGVYGDFAVRIDPPQRDWLRKQKCSSTSVATLWMAEPASTD